MKIKVLGSAITYGAGGPKVDVRVSASVDAGEAWSDLFSGKAVVGNETQTLTNLPDGTPITLRFNGRYSWLFNKTYTSNANDGHTYALKNGDTLPKYKTFDNQASLESFLRPIIGSNGKISIGPKDVLFLVELGTLDSQASDFQDVVVLVTFTEKVQTCTDSSKPRVKLQFDRVANTGAGDLEKKIYAGPQSVAFSENQWIPLKDKNGATIIDGGIVEDVKGIAFERGNGWIRIINHGSHPNSSGKEIADVGVSFNHAYITSTVNEVDQNASENPIDGNTNDTSAGDEFVPGPNVKFMTFKTRTTTGDDGVILYWAEGNPSNASSSSSSSTSSSSSSSAPVADACGVPFTVNASGLLTLKGKADISVKIAGAESTYGVRGPRVDVRTRISFDEGASWQQLYAYRALRGNELKVFPNVASGSKIMLEFNGRYSWVFNRTVTSGRSDARVRVLQNKQTFSGLSSLVNSGQMKKYLRDLIDNSSKVNLTGRDVVYLIELGDIAEAKFHDAVAIISVDRPASLGPCAGASSSASSASSTSSSSSSSSINSNEDTDLDGIKNSDDLCPFSTTVPESVPTEYMTFERYALTGARGNVKKIPVFRTGPRKQVSDYTLEDTRGCSCTQLLDAIEGKGYHRFEDYPALYRQMKNLFSFYVSTSRKFGCAESLMRMVSESR